MVSKCECEKCVWFYFTTWRIPKNTKKRINITLYYNPVYLTLLILTTTILLRVPPVVGDGQPKPAQCFVHRQRELQPVDAYRLSKVLLLGVSFVCAAARVVCRPVRRDWWINAQQRPSRAPLLQNVVFVRSKIQHTPLALRGTFYLFSHQKNLYSARGDLLRIVFDRTRPS